MRFVLAAALLAAGCNTVFGIEQTRPLDAGVIVIDVDTDLDGDGTVDRLDNCPIVPNDQSDRDGDGTGDVCDACPTGEIQNPADEDEDGVVDECDNCPGLENRNQLDGDGDGIGDVCDLLPTAQHRVLFDGFGPVSSAWTTPWPGMGVLQPTTFPSEMVLPGHTLTGNVDREWHVEAGIDMDFVDKTQGKFGFRLTNPNTGVYFECGILVTPSGRTTGYNQLGGAATTNPGNFEFVVPRTTLRASLSQPAASGPYGIECAWDVVAYPFSDGNNPDAMTQVGLSLIATRPEAIRYVDVISE